MAEPCSFARSSFEALAVADQTMMRSLSKLFMRRIVREPLSPQETAKVAVAFSALRVLWLVSVNQVPLLVVGRRGELTEQTLRCVMSGSSTQPRWAFAGNCSDEELRCVAGWPQHIHHSPLLRPEAIQALSWMELAHVAVAYASLRLYSPSLFSALLGRLELPKFPQEKPREMRLSQGKLLGRNL